MAWYATRHLSWEGRKVAPGDLIVADGELPPCNMTQRARMRMCIEAPPGWEPYQPNPHTPWRLRKVRPDIATAAAPPPSEGSPSAGWVEHKITEPPGPVAKPLVDVEDVKQAAPPPKLPRKTKRRTRRKRG